jgi:hypothetical protein
MHKKAFKPPRIAPLQRVVAEPVTDPAEIAAMEQMRKRLKQKQTRLPKKVFKPFRIAPLQHIKAEPITDPAEIAAIDEMRKRLKQKQKGRPAKASRKGAKAASKKRT